MNPRLPWRRQSVLPEQHRARAATVAVEPQEPEAPPQARSRHAWPAAEAAEAAPLRSPEQLGLGGLGGLRYWGDEWPGAPALQDAARALPGVRPPERSGSGG